MRTDQLIDSLVADIAPMRRDMIERRLLLGLLGGGIVTAAVMLVWLGLRADLMPALGRPTIWMKWGYTLSLGGIAIVGVRATARPDGGARTLGLAIIPVAALAALALMQLAMTPRDDWAQLWLGQSWRDCPGRVLLLSLPIFAGLLWAFRRFAPTRLRLAGAMAGLAAGALSATIYGFACPETSAVFVMTWYTLGIAGAMALGALLGPRVLRW